MTTLPTVLMTDVIRSAHQGDSHGGAYLIDLAAGSFEQVLDWNDLDIDWQGRGTGRGLRGIAFHGDNIVIAASEKILVFDRSFKLLRWFENKFLSHCHEIFLEGDRLFVTSTRFDSILELDLASGSFVAGTWIRATPAAQGRSKSIEVVPFDPESANGPTPQDTLHINSVWRRDGLTYLGGVRVPGVLAIRGSELALHAKAPPWTHNARPHLEGVLYNSTDQDAIIHAQLDGTIIESFAITQYPPAELLHAGLPQDFARQGFGRGLCTTAEGLIIGGSSPGTVSAYQPGVGKVAAVNVSMDVRNAPHGLELWPW